jgi:hypothetical protein
MSNTSALRSRFAVAGLAVCGAILLTPPGAARQPPTPPADPTAITDGALVPFDAIPDGARSPRNANYSIDVRLDPDTRTLTGRAVLTWRNIAPRPTPDLRFHLYYNAWRNSRSTWMRERALSRGSGLEARPETDWGWIDVTAVRLLGDAGPRDLTQRTRFISPDDANADDRTVLAVEMPTPVAPGEAVNIEIEWRSRVPRTFARTGAIGDFFFIAQWFPKIGVLEEAGWNCHQFHANTEFFSDYGVYDVRITVPTGWVLGATGVEEHQQDNADGTTTHRYVQDDVHDFAWTTSPDFLDQTERFEVPGLPPVQMRLLLQPEHAGQAARHFAATRATLEHYGQWYGPYPYEQITIVDPAWQSGAGGMEYPTLFTAGARWLAPPDVSQPEDVTIHEAGHQFWYGVVGNNEFEHAWLDEGLNTFSTARALEASFSPNHVSRRYFGGFVPFVFRDIAWSRATDGNRLATYRNAGRTNAQQTPSYLYWPGTAGAITYDKTALWLHTLERHLGWEQLREILSVFYDRWQFRHPDPEDFFAVANEVSGRDLSWYFEQVHGGSQTFDYAVHRVASRPLRDRGYVERDPEPIPGQGPGPVFSDTIDDRGLTRTTVTVRRHGDGIFPVDVLVVFDDDETVRERWDGRDPWQVFTYERAAAAVRVHVDPDRVLLLDVDYANNSWTATPRAGTAATKWALRWMIWLQDLMLTYAFLV